MAVMVTGGELIDVAVGIEKSGATFYEYMLNTTHDLRAQVMFKYLAEMEREHVTVFQKLRSASSDYDSPISSSEEYAVYLDALVKSAVFSGEMAARKMAEKVTKESDAVDIAIRAEKDSILFYTAIKELVRRTDAEVIDRIAQEERAHLTQLSEFKRSLERS